MDRFSCVQEVLLFGSYLYLEKSPPPHIDGDIDIAIFCPTASHKDWISIVSHIQSSDPHINVNCVRLDKLKHNNPLKLYILDYGIYLYRKELKKDL